MFPKNVRSYSKYSLTNGTVKYEMNKRAATHTKMEMRPQSFNQEICETNGFPCLDMSKTFGYPISKYSSLKLYIQGTLYRQSSIYTYIICICIYNYVDAYTYVCVTIIHSERRP